MAGIYSGMGRIIALRDGEGGGTPLLEVKINARTGEKKTEEMEYAPSNIVKMTFWDNQAKALGKILEKGQTVYFSGNLAQLEPYEYNEELRCDLVLKYPNLEIAYGASNSSDEEEQAPKETKKSTKGKAKTDELFGEEETPPVKKSSSKKKAQVEVFEEDDDDDFFDDDLE